MDLLFEKAQYEEVVALVNDVRNKSLGGLKLPKPILTLALGAMYKIVSTFFVI